MHSGDLDTVLADHADDLVMFDVPPPDDGVRDIAAYGETWPPFFEWQRTGASFEIVSLDVTAGRRRRVRLGAPALRYPRRVRADPANRHGLTVGLRKQDGRRMVTREHHSFPDKC